MRTARHSGGRGEKSIRLIIETTNAGERTREIRYLDFLGSNDLIVCEENASAPIVGSGTWYQILSYDKAPLTIEMPDKVSASGNGRCNID